MEPNTNEATAPKRLKNGGRKPLIIVGVIVGILVAAYLVCCVSAEHIRIPLHPDTPSTVWPWAA